MVTLVICCPVCVWSRNWTADQFSHIAHLTKNHLMVVIINCHRDWSSRSPQLTAATLLQWLKCNHLGQLRKSKSHPLKVLFLCNWQVEVWRVWQHVSLWKESHCEILRVGEEFGVYRGKRTASSCFFVQGHGWTFTWLWLSRWGNKCNNSPWETPEHDLHLWLQKEVAL